MPAAGRSQIGEASSSKTKGLSDADIEKMLENLKNWWNSKKEKKTFEKKENIWKKEENIWKKEENIWKKEENGCSETLKKNFFLLSIKKFYRKEKKQKIFQKFNVD